MSTRDLNYQWRALLIGRGTCLDDKKQDKQDNREEAIDGIGDSEKEKERVGQTNEDCF